MPDQPTNTLDDITVVKWKRVADVLGVSTVTLWRWRKDDTDFPPVVKFSRGMQGITKTNLKTYIEKRSVR